MTDQADDPAQPDGNADEQLPTLELESLLNRPPSWRKRLVQLGLLLAGGAMFLAMFWGAVAPGQPAASAPTPQPTKEPATLLITSDVNYGTVTVNGKQQRKSPPLLIKIQGDTYDITLDAPPFRPKSCHIQLSSAQSDFFGTCQVSPTDNQLLSINGSLASPAFQINIILTFDDLPADQQSQVNTLLTQSLTTEQDLTVPAGFYFATGLAPSGQITSQRTVIPLRANAIVAPVPSSSDGPALCAGLICPGNFSLDPVPTGHRWSVRIAAALRWRFSTTAGTVVGDVAFPAGSFWAFSLSYDIAAGWSIPQEGGLAPTPYDEVYCTTGEGLLGQLGNNATGSVDTGTSHDQGAQGCEILLLVNNVDQGTYLWRFGVLMAADAKAHAFLPELPVAPPAELAAIGA